MKVELSCTPAIHLGDECVLPERKVWDVILSEDDRKALSSAAEAIAELGDDFPVDRAALAAMARAVEIVQLVGGDEE